MKFRDSALVMLMTVMMVKRLQNKLKVVVLTMAAIMVEL